MSKRQIRLNSISIFKEDFSKIVNQNVNIVLKSGAVFFVKPLSLNNDEIIVENMRRKKSSILLKEINEIIAIHD